ncbi:MAG: HEPN domain-containing protein [Nanoarchaeota archaeon]
MNRRKTSDVKKAISLINSSNEDMKYTTTLDINESSANTIVRNVYECFRMLGEALLAKKGIESKDHATPINELISLQIKTARPLNILDNLRRLRRNVNYYGYKSTSEDAKNAINFSKECFFILLKEVNKRVND